MAHTVRTPWVCVSPGVKVGWDEDSRGTSATPSMTRRAGPVPMSAVSKRNFKQRLESSSHPLRVGGVASTDHEAADFWSVDVFRRGEDAPLSVIQGLPRSAILRRIVPEFSHGVVGITGGQ